MGAASPPPIPPAVLMSTPSHALPTLGKRRRKAPASNSSDAIVRPAERTALSRISLRLRSQPGTSRPPGGDSHGKALAYIGTLELVAVTGDHDSATLHQRKAVCELAGELEVLLDEQNGHLSLRPQVGDRAGDILDDGRLDALGGFIEDEQARPGDEC